MLSWSIEVETGGPQQSSVIIFCAGQATLLWVSSGVHAAVPALYAQPGCASVDLCVAVWRGLPTPEIVMHTTETKRGCTQHQTPW